jgi:hypothetical protein
MKRTLIAATLGFSLVVIWLAGCSNTGEGVSQAKDQTPEALLANAVEAMNDDRPSVGSYASALKQLDNYIALAKKDPSTYKLSKDEQQLIERQLLQGVREGQPNDPISRTRMIGDLQRDSFLLVDAFHLDACFLFHDAAQALQQYYIGERPIKEGPELNAYRLELARQAFEWVMRQVQLQAAPPGLDPWPAQEILRRGTGDAEERSRVFLALLEQLNLDGCMVPRSIDVMVEDRREPRELPWAPGVLIGNEVYLFETRLGKPIPSADGKGIATLRETLKNPEILKKLYASDSDPVTLAQLERPAVLLPSSLPALAPRMRELQSWLRDADNQTVVYEDLLKTRKRFQDASLGVDIRLWTNRLGNPALILNRHAENPNNEQRLQDIIIPRKALIPAWFHELASKMHPVVARTLYYHFDRLFLIVRVQPTNIEEEKVQREGQALVPGISNQPERVQKRRGGVRDLLVRGRPEQTVERALDLEAKLQKMMETFHGEVEAFQGRQEQELKTTWAKELLAAQERFNELKVRAQTATDKGQAMALEEELRKAYRVLDGKLQEQDSNVSYLSAEWALPEITEHLTYFMALAKMELAIRAETQASLGKRGPASGVLTPAQQWQSAGDWFERYNALVLGKPRHHWAVSTAKHLATCREAEARLEKKN